MKKIYFTLLVSFLIITGTASATNISGTMLYLNNPEYYLPGVVVSLKALPNGTTTTCITDSLGHYSFTNVAAGSYRLSASTDMSGYQIGWESAWMVLAYLCGQTQLTPIQFLAADVNGNGKVKLNDLALIINHLLFGAPFPVGEWVFESYDFTVNGSKDQPGGMSGASAGDLTGVFIPTSRSLEAFPVEHNTQVAASADEEFTLDLVTRENLSLTAAGLTFNFPAELVNIESAEFATSDYQYVVEGNQLKLVWYGSNESPLELEAGSKLATLHCRATSAFGPGSQVNIEMDNNSSLAGANFTKITGAKLTIPAITYAVPSLRISNYPNPCVGSTTLNYYQPEDGKTTLRIFSYNGQLVHSMPLSGSKGYHQVEIDATRWQPGNYICKIQCDGIQKYSESHIIIKTN